MRKNEQSPVHGDDVDAPAVPSLVSRDQLVLRFSDRPAFLDRKYAKQLFASILGGSSGATLIDDQGPVDTSDKLRIKGMISGSSGDRHRPYRVERGIAVVPVSGPLMHKWPYHGLYSTGYGALLRVVSMAADDTEVSGILLDMDTPGGEVAGCFDTAQQLRELGKKKPIAALCNDMNLSAGMCLASAAEHRFITQTGEAGSVGVVMAHFSYEEMDKRMGLKATLIYSGERKVDGNPYRDLPEEVFANFQNECHDLRQEFASIVGEHVGMDVADVLATEAAVYRGQAAIDVGFADELVNGHEAVSAFEDYLSSQGRSITTGATMSDDKNRPSNDGKDGAQPAGTSAEQSSSEAVASAASAKASNAERVRIEGILSHESAKGREALASHLAFKTDLSVEDAAKTMAAAESTADTKSPGEELDAAMQDSKQPGVGADAKSDDAEPDAASGRILSAYREATGRK